LELTRLRCRREKKKKKNKNKSSSGKDSRLCLFDERPATSTCVTRKHGERRRRRRRRRRREVLQPFGS
jgi:hypothetical protein